MVNLQRHNRSKARIQALLAVFLPVFDEQTLIQLFSYIFDMLKLFSKLSPNVNITIAGINKRIKIHRILKCSLCNHLAMILNDYNGAFLDDFAFCNEQSKRLFIQMFIQTG